MIELTVWSLEKALRGKYGKNVQWWKKSNFPNLTQNQNRGKMMKKLTFRKKIGSFLTKLWLFKVNEILSGDNKEKLNSNRNK